jgi:DNA processing protein
MIGKEFIVKLLQLSRVKRKTAKKILNEIYAPINTNIDLFEFLSEICEKIRIPKYSKSEFNTAMDKGSIILEKSSNLNISLISCLDSEYPQKLLNTNDFPLVLSFIGDLTSLNSKYNVAVIGTREPTISGKVAGRKIGARFAESNINIVSGLAKGSDTAAHLGALDVGGTTTAVLAHGLDQIYPKENELLSKDIISKGGLLISEYFVGQKPFGNLFVERDRIQAGISECVFVIETDIKGGTMHTVNYCLSYNRQLACINHPSSLLHEPTTRGNQYLIKEKLAIPISSKEDLEELIRKIVGTKSLKKLHINNIRVKGISNETRESSDELNNGKQLPLWD